MLPQPIQLGGDIVVYPLSLAHYALLEKINSPLLREGTAEESTLDLLPSLYVATHNAKDVFNDFENLLELSLEWAGTLQPSMMQDIKQAITAQIKVMLDVIASPADSKKKARGIMGGLRRWFSGHRQPFAKIFKKLFGRPPQV